MSATSYRQAWIWPTAVIALGLMVGALAGINPKLAIVASLGILIVLVMLTDLTNGLVAFTFLILVALVPAGGGVSFLKLAGLLLAFSWLATIVWRGGTEVNFTGAHPGLSYTIIVFIVWVALSQIWAEDAAAVRVAVSSYVLNAILFLIVFTAVRSERDLVRVMGALVAGASVAALYGVLQPPSSADVERLSGTLGNPNELAAVLVVGAVFAVGLAVVARRAPLWRLAAIAGTAICVIGIMLTLSRTGLIALGFAGLAALIFGGRWRIRVLPVILLLAMLAGTYLFAVASPDARDRVLQPDSSGTGRVDLWTIGRRIIDEHPVNGVGAGNFPVSSIHFLLEPGALTRSDFVISDPKVAHNTYLEIWAELGVVGFALFISILLICIRCALRAARAFSRDGNRHMELLARVLVIALIGLLAADFFESEEFQKTLWLLLALCPAVLAISRSGSSAETPARAG